MASADAISCVGGATADHRSGAALASVEPLELLLEPLEQAVKAIADANPTTSTRNDHDAGPPLPTPSSVTSPTAPPCLIADRGVYLTYSCEKRLLCEAMFGRLLLRKGTDS